MLLIGRVNRYVVRGVGSGDEDTVREAKAGRVSLGSEDDRLTAESGRMTARRRGANDGG
jgi:hypothetical protein